MVESEKNLTEKFIQIAKECLKNNFKKGIEKRHCPDQYVGKIDDFENQKEDFKRVEIGDYSKSDPSVVLIMESPHKNEFCGNLGPAKGATGRQIRKHIKEVVGLSEYKNHELILMNAIQYQCSLGYSTNRYRDEVFQKMWANGAKINFVKRLAQILETNNVDIIINSCTKGNGKIELRELVQEAIPTSDREVVRRTHPFSWFSKKNRDSEL